MFTKINDRINSDIETVTFNHKYTILSYPCHMTEITYYYGC